MKRLVGLIAVSIAIFAFSRSAAEEKPQPSWPTFRGADRSGMAIDQDLLTSWPAHGPRLLWRAVGTGRGYGSVSIANGRAYVLGDRVAGSRDRFESLTCYDTSNGRQLWKARTGPAWDEGEPTWQGSRSTPTVIGEQVLAMTPFGRLVCFDTEGTVQWYRDLPREFAGTKADSWGYSESPLVDGDQVVCTPGGTTNTMLALNRATGDVIWATSRSGDRGAGHSSIAVTEIGGTRVYVQSTGSGAMGVRAADGKLLWTFNIDPSTAVIPTPIVRNDYVFFVSGYGTGGSLLQQIPHAGGDVTMRIIYPLKQQLANKHGGVVLVGDYLYGDSEDRGILYCAELATGKIRWRSRGAGRESGAIAAADGHLYIHYADGTMSLAKASPDQFDEVASFMLPGAGVLPGWSHPVIVDGKLYVREAGAILCYDIGRDADNMPETASSATSSAGNF